MKLIDLIKYAFEFFKDFLIMPPAYYKGNTDEGVLIFMMYNSKVLKDKNYFI